MTIIRWLFLSLILILASCGGGTTGTDGGADLRIRGTLKTTTGEPITNALITVTATGDSAETLDNGNFEIVTSNVTTSALLIEGNLNGAPIAIHTEELDLSEIKDSETLTLTLVVQGSDFQVSVVVLEPIPPTVPTPIRTQNPTSENPDTDPSLIRGVVRDESGTPVAGVHVRSHQGRETKTNKNGVFEILLTGRPDHADLTLSYLNKKGRIRIGNLPNHAFTLSLECTVSVPDPDAASSADTTFILSSDYTLKPKTRTNVL